MYPQKLASICLQFVCALYCMPFLLVRTYLCTELSVALYPQKIASICTFASKQFSFHRKGNNIPKHNCAAVQLSNVL